MQWCLWAAICSETWRTSSLRVDLSNSLWIFFFVHCRAQRCLHPVAWLRHCFVGHHLSSSFTEDKNTSHCYQILGWGVQLEWIIQYCNFPVQTVACTLLSVTFFDWTRLTHNLSEVGTKIGPESRFCQVVNTFMFFYLHTKTQNVPVSIFCIIPYHRQNLQSFQNYCTHLTFLVMPSIAKSHLKDVKFPNFIENEPVKVKVLQHPTRHFLLEKKKETRRGRESMCNTPKIEA